MSFFEYIRTAVITMLRADKIEFEPRPRALARAVVSRRLDQLEIRASGVPIENSDVRLDQLDIVAHDVRLSLSLRGPLIVVGSAYFSARLTQEQLSELVPLPLGVDRLSVTTRGFTFHTVAGIPIYTSVTLADNKLMVSPSAPAKVPLLDLIGIDINLPQLPAGAGLEQLTRFGLSFPLPELPANATIDELELHDGYAIASGTLDLTPDSPEA